MRTVFDDNENDQHAVVDEYADRHHRDYAITIANAANRSSASNLIISDTLPTGFTFNTTGTVTLSGGATRPSTSNPTVGDAVPNWGTFTIPSGGSVVLNFTARVAYTAAGTLQNPATATYTDPARTVSNGTTTSSYNSASSTGEDVTVVGGPNVGLVKSVSPPARKTPGLIWSIQ